MSHPFAKFGLGAIVRHRDQAFRGVVIDVDAVYGGPAGEPRPVSPDQPFYQVFAIGDDGGFIAYAAEDVLEPELEITPLTRAEQAKWFHVDARGRHAPRTHSIH
jgi:heat shock protein HspQ